MLLFLIWPRCHWREARLWRAISKVRTFGLSGHVLHLRGAANGLLAKIVPTRGWMLGSRLSRPHLDIEGGLAWG